MAQGWSGAKVLPGITSLHCQLNVNGGQAARPKEQLMESVVSFLLICLCERTEGCQRGQTDKRGRVWWFFRRLSGNQTKQAALERVELSLLPSPFS